MPTYNEGRLRMIRGSAGGIDIVADAGIKLMLLSSAYTPDQDHDFVNDVSAAELSCTGYVGGFGGSGRKALASRVIAVDLTNNLVKFTAANITWTTPNGATARYGVFFKEITSDALSPLIGYFDINPTAGITFDGNDWTLVCPSNGFLKWTSP